MSAIAGRRNSSVPARSPKISKREQLTVGWGKLRSDSVVEGAGERHPAARIEKHLEDNHLVPHLEKNHPAPHLDSPEKRRPTMALLAEAQELLGVPERQETAVKKVSCCTDTTENTP